MSVITAVTMPKWGMEMSEGVISNWYFAVGDEVTEDADLVDIETSKIVNTITAPCSGVLRAIIANPGDTFNVGHLLGVIAPADVSDDEVNAFIQKLSGQAAPQTAPTAEPEAAPEITPVADNSPAETQAATPTSEKTSVSLGALSKGGDDSEVSATVIARRLAKQYQINLNNISPTGSHDRVNKADIEAAIRSAGGQIERPATSVDSANINRDDSDVKATSVARRLATSLKVNLLDCRASGDRGRVCKADVEAVAARRNTPPPAVVTPPVDDTPEFTEVAMSGMRKVIAKRLQESKQTAPHFRVNVDACIDELLATRTQINNANRQAKVSVNDFIVKACACALQKVPAMNIQFTGDTIRQFSHADISVAVAIDDGLITPIVRAAETKGLLSISNEIRDLATRAKIGRLTPNEFQGGTFCVSNLGMYGIKSFDAIINPPQAAILAVGTGEQRPVVRNGELAVATMMSLSLASDHRVIDGALAAEFMHCLKGFLEQPATMLG
ncbi:2-oxo acid dehydrogenase subunit E2 [Zhongshania sp. BJYM1]|uniref:2-oxo acid dehydrogenase subunit E2 n=1 Tax=Zhongshania aquatica TaxID=2965069 RepID=UPI0022B5BF86|nr:2-oxo acid dehydrogenase subunit E2 [Marortus sp. BJYM1]